MLYSAWISLKTTFLYLPTTPPLLCSQPQSSSLLVPLVGTPVSSPSPFKCPRCVSATRLVQDVQATLPASDPRPPSWGKPTVWKLYSTWRLPDRGAPQLYGRSEIPPAAPHERRPAFKELMRFERWDPSVNLINKRSKCCFISIICLLLYAVEKHG